MMAILKLIWKPKDEPCYYALIEVEDGREILMKQMGKAHPDGPEDMFTLDELGFYSCYKEEYENKQQTHQDFKDIVGKVTRE